MTRNHLSMRKIKELMRLKFECGCSNRAIARSIGVSSSTVSECVRRIKKAQLTWPLSENLTEDQLEGTLYPMAQQTQIRGRQDIDWTFIHKELKRKHVTLRLLWSEYKQAFPDGIGYTQFCYHYGVWREQLEVWMRQPHKAGERLFVDYAGQTMPVIIDRRTGEIQEAQIFVGTLGASNFTYVEATWTQTLPDWINSHVNAFEYMEGCPEIVVPDNLKTGVHKANFYEPDINPTYQDMATYYGVAIIPTRVASPKDKAKVENGVLQVERQILAKLRNRTFFSLHELNEAIRPLLDALNQRPFQKLPGSRLSCFLEIEKPALRSLPATRYVYAEWKKVRAGCNYHIEIDSHFYSVPFQFIKKELHARYTTKTVEVFYKDKRIASHIRSYVKQGYTTETAHMPKRHQKYAEWTPERVISWAKKIGPSTAQFIEAVMASRPHPQQGFRSCLGILRLAKSYGDERLEAACARGLSIGAYTYKSIESILKKGLDQKPLPIDANAEKTIPAAHEYVRGQGYFE